MYQESVILRRYHINFIVTLAYFAVLNLTIPLILESPIWLYHSQYGIVVIKYI